MTGSPRDGIESDADSAALRESIRRAMREATGRADPSDSDPTGPGTPSPAVDAGATGPTAGLADPSSLSRQLARFSSGGEVSSSEQAALREAMRAEMRAAARRASGEPAGRSPSLPGDAQDLRQAVRAAIAASDDGSNGRRAARAEPDDDAVARGASAWARRKQAGRGEAGREAAEARREKAQRAEREAAEARAAVERAEQERAAVVRAEQERGRHASRDEGAPEAEPVDGGATDDAFGAAAVPAEPESTGQGENVLADPPRASVAESAEEEPVADDPPSDDDGAAASGISLEEFLKTPVDDLLHLPMDQLLHVLAADRPVTHADREPESGTVAEPGPQPARAEPAVESEPEPAAAPEPASLQEPEPEPESAIPVESVRPPGPEQAAERASEPEPEPVAEPEPEPEPPPEAERPTAAAPAPEPQAAPLAEPERPVIPAVPAATAGLAASPAQDDTGDEDDTDAPDGTDTDAAAFAGDATESARQRGRRRLKREGREKREWRGWRGGRARASDLAPAGLTADLAAEDLDSDQEADDWQPYQPADRWPDQQPDQEADWRPDQERDQQPAQDPRQEAQDLSLDPDDDAAPTSAHRTRRSVDNLPPRASLTPVDRVIPTWTDPTASRAATLIGGPLGTHASVGRNRVFTPLRVVLLFAIAALIVGWLAKSPCIQTGADGTLDQGGQKPWITGCYNDIVPLYASRGLNDAGRDPYSYSWVDNGPDQPAGQVYPRAEVRQDGAAFVVDQGGVATAVGTGDLVYDASHGYARVQDGELVTVPVIGGEAGSSTAPAGSPTVRHLEYPVLTGYFMWGAAALTAGYLHLARSTGLLPQPLDVGAYFTITALLLGLFYLWAVAATARLARRRIWDVAMLGLAPLLMVHAFTNWDLLAVGFTAGGMAAWARGRRIDPADVAAHSELVQIEGGGFTHVVVRGGGDRRSIRWAVLAGVLLGLGAAAKLYPALLLGPLFILCLRSGALKRFWYALGGAVVAWLVVNLPIMLAYPQAWSEFFVMNTSRGPEWDSWYFLSTLILPTGSLFSDASGGATTLLNAGSLVLFLVACGAIAWLGLAAKRRPRFAQLAFLVVVAFLLTNKVFSPQYSLWLLPLVVLALPRWRPIVLWQLSEVVVWFLLMLSFDTDAGKNLPIEPFGVAAVVRGALLITLVVMVVRDILAPERDRVRTAGDDDPSGGPLDGAEDVYTIAPLPSLWRRRSTEDVRGAVISGG